jgi:DNA-binding PadR family transcriptional regulator
MGLFQLGEFEELVLMSVAGLNEDAYTVSLQRYLERTINRNSTMGAIYRALDRLERKGFVQSWLGEVTPERGGKRKRYYRITATGMESLRHIREMRTRIWREIEEKPAWNPI